MVRIVLSLRNHEPSRSSEQSVHRIRHTGQTKRSADTHLTPCTVIASIATLIISLALALSQPLTALLLLVLLRVARTPRRRIRRPCTAGGLHGRRWHLTLPRLLRFRRHFLGLLRLLALRLLLAFDGVVLSTLALLLPILLLLPDARLQSLRLRRSPTSTVRDETRPARREYQYHIPP